MDLNGVGTIVAGGASGLGAATARALAERGARVAIADLNEDGANALADELGGYNGIEKGGYLQSFLFRSARLVVDTGLNSKGWSREQAVEYMTKTTGFPRARVQREVERYCISIGQACSYKVGHLAWLRAREKAKSILGAKFDIKQFHEVLKDGAMPLTILERRERERAAAQARA